ncbi:MAG: hypothetical protein AB7G75_35150 [Candidatus Binatia bacterium]
MLNSVGPVTIRVLAVAFICCIQSAPAHGQGQYPLPRLGPMMKPLIKFIGYLNPTIEPNNVKPVITFKLPGDEKRYTFLVTDMKIMAGPLLTPESILAAVKPYSPNFLVHTSPEISKTIAESSPAERLTILAQYSPSDRILLVQGVEKQEAE